VEIDGDASRCPLVTFLECEGRAPGFCDDVLASVKRHAAGDECIEIGYWDVTFIEVWKGHVHIQSDACGHAGELNRSELTVGEFERVLTEWREFVAGRREPGWRTLSHP
jgi:hypothetical protein